MSLPPDLQDQILGCLLGSAIGDAMGAPVEMWPRADIQATYGHIAHLLPLQRPASPEGPWGDHLPAGSSTDDTRWKALLIEWMAAEDHAQIHTMPPEWSASSLARFILHRYHQYLRALPADGHETALEHAQHQALWVKEWARVAAAYLSGDLDEFAIAQARFYGGEMVCGGMLFAPVIGAAYPGEAEKAYEQAFQLNIYDSGYARDLGGLTAALVAEASQPGCQPADLEALPRKLDPRGYFHSRLVGRSAYELFRLAQGIANEALSAREADVEALPVPLCLPFNTPDARQRYSQWSIAYHGLDQHLFRLPFHPGELWLVMWTALLVCRYDFRQTLAFIVNYGRDNDTTAAIAGAILGAFYGAKALPQDLTRPTLQANLSLGYDLPGLAQRLALAVSEKENRV